jgi:tRNA (cmo5U34)-methyltransferase
VFSKIYAALKPTGSFWIVDLIEHSIVSIQQVSWQRYGEYLTQLRGEPYRNGVLSCIEQEDTPRSLLFQTDLLCSVGFSPVEVLHKNNCFAAFGAIKPELSSANNRPTRG